MLRFRLLGAGVLVALVAACGGGNSVLTPLSGATNGNTGSNLSNPTTNGQIILGASLTPQDQGNNGISVSPKSLTFASPSAPSQTFTATTRYQTDFAAACANTSVCTVNSQKDPNDRNDRKKSETFTVTPTGGGTTVITVTDKKGNTASVAVTVEGPSGKIYVVSFFNGTVMTYNAAGMPTPPTTISTGLNTPTAVAVDAAGKIYVANIGDGITGNGTVTTYTANGTQTTPTITGLTYPNGVAVDAAGKIYVSGNNDTVTTYNAAGMPTPPTKITMGLAGTTGVAVDAAGKIYVANQSNSTVTTYNADGTPTNPTIMTGLNNPTAVAVDAAGKIYVTNSDSTLTIYNAGGGSPLLTIVTGLYKPFGVAVDAAGKIYVANFAGNNVTTYVANFVNNTYTQTSPTITLAQPYGVAVH